MGYSNPNPNPNPYPNPNPNPNPNPPNPKPNPNPNPNPNQVVKLLEDVYDGEAPGYETSTFLSFFDVDNDGKISWDEFAEALGASQEESSPADLVRG